MICNGLSLKRAILHFKPPGPQSLKIHCYGTEEFSPENEASHVRSRLRLSPAPLAQYAAYASFHLAHLRGQG